MKTGLQAQVKAPSQAAFTPVQVGLLQRKCACGGSAGLSGQCDGCQTKKLLGLQTKLEVNEPGDIYEREADRIADQVLATPAHPAVSGAPPRIQRFSGQSNGQVGAMPASVDQALTSPGRSLEPALRQDMEQRFGHDFTQVRVHSDAAAERSARDVNANAYTVGHDVVFGAGHFSPGTHEGRQLIAHELTHVVQQTGSSPQVQRKKQPAAAQPRIDVSKLTDAEKAELRERIRGAIEENTEAVLKMVEAISIGDAERKIVDGWRRELGDALRKIKGQPAGRQRDVGQEVTEAALGSLSDDLTVKFYLFLNERRIWFNRKTIAMIGKGTPLKEEHLKSLESEAVYFRSGARGMLRSKVTALIYEKLGVKPEELRTEEETESEAEQRVAGGSQPTVPGQTPPTSPTPDPSATPRTVEDRLLLQDLYASLPEAPDSPVGNEAELLKQFKDMSAQEREQFKRFLQTTNKPGVDPKPLSDTIADFKSLSPVDREVMEVNKRLGEEEPAGEQKRLEGPMLLDLKNEAEQLANTAQTYDKYRAAMAQMRSSIQDPSQRGPSLPDLGIQVFVNEMAMAQGLMVGAAEASPLVKPVVQALVSELMHVSENISKEFAKEAATSLALMLIPGGQVAEIINAGRLIKKYHDKFEALAKVYRTAEKIEHIIDLISGLGDTYQRFRELYQKGIATYEAAQALLSDINGPEDLEERIEAEKDKLIEQFEQLLEGKLGDLLEMMYIPADTPPDDLVKLIFNIPRGLEALGRMWGYYTSPESKSKNAEAILMIRGFEAGKLLYPFVGLLVAEVDKALSALIGRITSATPLIDRLMPSSERTGGKERGRSLFRRRNRKRTKISDAVLQPYFDEGFTEFNRLIEADEPGQHWAPAWFRFALRKEVKELNQKFSKKTVKAEVEQKTGKGGSKTKTTTTEQVPLPEFRLRFSRPRRGAKEIQYTFELNPKKTGKADLLSDDDFDKSIKYEGRQEKRKEAIRDWLGDAGYQLTRDNKKNLHIRLPGGEQEKKGRSYLRFASGSIVKWNPKREKNDDYKNFLGRTVGTSADLPEGYLLPSASDKGDDSGSAVQRKKGLADALDQIGLDENQHLVPGAGKKQPENIWPAKLKIPPGTEGYLWSDMVDAMFAKPGDYNLQEDKVKDKSAWLKLIENTRYLQRRPIRWEGSLGYTVRARMGSDRIKDRHLPELKKRDDKGHLVARRFDSNDEYENLIPMKRSINQAPGKWYTLEQDMAQSYTGKQHKPNEYVKFKLDVQYPNSKTRRPNLFTMTWTKMVATKAQQPGSNDKSLETHTDVFNNE